MLRLMLAVAIGAVALGVDRTLTPEADGRVVVEAVVDRIRSNCIFGDDRLFLRRLAFVETSDGEDPKTYRSGYHGGIWQIDESKFDSIYCSYSYMRPTCDLINSVFNIDWESVTWSDLRKPLYSGLAAALVIQSNRYTRRDTLANQAYFWSRKIRVWGDQSEFIQKSSNLPGSECKTELDLAFIIDGSGSVSHSDFDKMLEFINEVVDNLNVNEEEIHVAAMEYSTYIGTTITFDSFTTKAELISSISNIEKGHGWTYTGSAIENTTSVIFSPSNGARPNAKKVAILLTDGASTNSSATQIAAAAAKASGITMISVGVGNANVTELEGVATAPNCTHVYLLDNFNEIDSLLYELKDSSCSAATVLPSTGANTEITKAIPENTTVTETYVAQPVPVNQDGNGGNGSTTTDGSGEEQTVVKSEVSCGSLEIFASYNTPRPGPAFYDMKDTAREGNPSVIYLNATHQGRPLYLTIVGSRLPVTAGVTSCLDSSYSVTVATEPIQASVVCQAGTNVRACTEEELRNSQYSNLFCDDTWSDVTNPCTPGQVSTHAHPADITKFIKCDVRGKMFITQCPDDGTFNPHTDSCSHEAIGGSDGTQLPTDVTSSCTSTNMAAGKFHFTYDADDSKFIQCDVWGNAWVKDCPADLVWNNDHSTCVHANAEANDPAAANPAANPAGTVTTTSAPASQSNPCAGDATFVAHASDPSKYIHCVHNQALEMSCPAGLVFKVAGGYCDWA